VDDFYPLDDFDDEVVRAVNREIGQMTASPIENQKLAAIEARRPEPFVVSDLNHGMPRWLSPLDVAELLKLDRHTVYRLLRDHELPGTKIGGRWFVSAEALAARIRGSD
jgi:excisionase family DNA binding protein